MSKTVSGTLMRINKNGRFYSVCVDDEWYGTGADRPDAEEGNMVEFEADRNGKYWNADMSTFQVTDSSTKAKKYEKKKSSYKASSGRTESYGGKEDYAAKSAYWTKKEERDVVNDHLRNIGAGRNTAIAFVDLLLKNGAIKLPAAEPKRADALFEAVEYYRVKFEEINSGPTPATPEVDEPESDDEDYDEDE